LTLGENSESVAQVGHVVFSLLVLVVNEFMALELLGWVVFGHVISSGSSINFVEKSVHHTRVLTSRELFLHLIEKSIVVTDSLAEHLEIKIIIETK